MFGKLRKFWRRRRDRGVAKEPSTTGLRSESLEPRVLFSADLPWVEADVSQAEPFDQSYEQSVAPVVNSESSAVQTAQADGQNLIVIDPSLLSQLQMSSSSVEAHYESAGFDVSVLQNTQNGISQLNVLLSSIARSGSIDVLTTAQPQGISLGADIVGVNDVLNSNSMISGWAGQLQAESGLNIQAVGLDQFVDAEHMADLLTTLTGANVELNSFAGVLPGTIAQPEQQARHEVVFVDTGVEGYQALVDDIQAGGDAGRTLEVILLDQNRDGVEQISEYLRGFNDLDAIHIVAHGTDGAIELGAGTLSNSTLATYDDALAGWQAALSDEADLLIYGCDLASSELGENLLRQVADLTGADVAASDDLTGAIELGGDWELEFTDGEIEAQLAFSESLQANWQQVLVTTPETLVNETTTGAQESNFFGGGSVASDAEGNYVVVWQDNSGSSYEVYARLYNADGTPNSSEFLVNSTTAGDQRSAAVAMDADGDFVITWTSIDQDSAGSHGVYAQRFDANGVAQGSEFLVNTNVTGDQGRSKIAMDDAGNFSISFTDFTTNSGDVFLQRYTANGSALGGNTTIHTTVSNSQGYSDMAIDGATGNIVVVWESGNQDGSGAGVYARMFDSNGVALTGELQVNVTTAGEQVGPKVDFTADGGFAVAWEEGISGSDMKVRVFDAAGAAISSEISVHAAVAGEQRFGDISADASGRFLVTWADDGNGGNSSIKAQLFAADGSKIGSEVLINETITGYRDDVSVSLVDGTATFSWWGTGAGDSTGVYARSVQFSNLVALSDSATVVSGAPVVIDVLANDSDVDGDPLVVLDLSDPANGTVVNNGDGTVTYTSNPGYAGPDSFSYIAADSSLNLQNYWAFDGDASDAVGSSNGTLNGTTTVAGAFGNGLAFNESSDYVQIPDVGYGAETSISFDFKLDDTTGSLFQYLYSHGDVDSTDSINVFVNEASHGSDPNVLRTVVRDGDDTLDNAALEVDIASLVGDGQWHNYTVTTGASGLAVYLDGVLVASDATRGTGPIDPAGDLYVGARQDIAADRFYGGALDSLSIYSSGLTAEQVSDLQSASATATVDITVEALAPTDIQTVATAGGGLSLNQDGGDSAYLLADNGSALLGGLTSLTYETRYSSLEPGGQSLVSYATTARDNEFKLVTQSNGDLLVQIGANSMQITDFDFRTLADGEDHTVSFSWQNSNGGWALYVDGVEEATGTGLSTGYAIDTAGTLVIGNEQDSVDGDYNSNVAHQATIFDARLFSDVRTQSEIASSYRSTLPFDEADMLANWQFDGLSSGGVVTDAVSGNNLTVKHATDPGFTASEPSLTFRLNENALDGSLVGQVAGVDAQREARIAEILASDSTLSYNAETNKFYKVEGTAALWTAAQSNAVAQSLGGVNGQLVTIHSAAEQEFVHEIASSSGETVVWLGGTDQTVEGEWRWQNGSDDAEQFWQGKDDGYNPEGRYHNFELAAGEPNDGGGEDYLRMYTSGPRDTYWDDGNSGSSHAYVIEWDADAVLDETQALTYSIESQTVDGAFAIDASTGRISVADGSLLDFETDALHTLTIRVTDVDSNTLERDFSVSLNNLNEGNNTPTDLSSGIELNSDGGNDAYLLATNGGAIFGGLEQFSAEISLLTAGTGQAQTLLSYEAPGGGGNEVLIGYTSAGDLEMQIHGGANSVNLGINVAELDDGNRHSLAITWDNTNGDWSLHVDGEYRSSGSGVATGVTLLGGGALVLGQDQDGVGTGFDATEHFSGTFYDVRIWDEVRSEAEIALNHQNKFDSGSLPSGLIANWQMDGIDGLRQVTDLVSGNDLTAKHVGATALTSWTNEMGGATASGSTITLDSATAPAGYESQVNSALFSSLGFTDDYTISFTLDEVQPYNFMIGLGLVEGGPSNTDIDHSFYFDESGALFAEGGGASTGVTPVAGDEFSLYVSGTTLEYKHNGTTVHSVAITANSDWYLDTSFTAQGDVSLSNIRLFEGDTEVTDFATSTPVDDLHINENARDGTSVGFVVPSDPEVTNDVVRDGLFREAADPGAFQSYAAPSTFGDWTVESGEIELLGTVFADSPLGGRSVDLNESSPGTISQTLTVEPGKQYQVIFALTGNYTGGESTKDIRVSVDGQSGDFTHTSSSEWSTSNPLWEHRSLTFTADDTSAVLRFTSLDAGVQGAIIADIQVVEIPAAVTTILNDDPTLSYDAATGKFYRFVNTPDDFETQLAASANASLNGVGGGLVRIDSAYENELIRQFVIDGGNDVWLGATDANDDGNWNWLDGTDESNDQFWTGGIGGSAATGFYVPTFLQSGAAGEDYVRINSEGAWVDDTHSGNLSYVIQWDASEVLSSYTFGLTDDAGGRFSIDGSTGELVVADGSLLDYESDVSHNVTIEVTDALGASYSESLIITIDNGFDATQSVPGPQSVIEGGILTFSSGGGNSVTVTDTLAATDARLQVFISTNFNGNLTLSQTTGLSILGGSNGGSFMTIQGTESDINAAFEGMVFTPNSDFNGSVTLNMTTSLGADMTGHYTFEGGTAIDQSVGLSQNGTLLNGAAVVTDAERGDVLELDATNREYVEINSTFGEPADVTLAAWVNFTTAEFNGGEVISIGNDVLIRVNEGATGFVAYFYDGTGHQLIASNVPIDDGNWHHIALTFDDAADTQRLYVDGQLATETNLTDSISYTGWWPITRIGSHVNDADTDFDFSGRIDDARIYTRALSSAEIAALATDDTQASDSILVTVGEVNDAPVLNQLDGDDLAAVNDGSTVILDAAATLDIVDLDGSSNFDGGFIQYSGTAFDGLDSLGLDVSGSVSLSGGFADGSVVSVGGVAIGTLAGVSNSTVTLNLNADSTLNRVETVMHSFTFDSTATTFGTRTVDITLNDGDGTANGGSDTATATLSVNLASSSNGTVSTNEDVTYTFSGSDFEFSGVLASDITSVTITNLPTSGVLLLDGNAVAAGQKISRADIDSNLLTYLPESNQSGVPAASFEFYVNNGYYAVNVLSGQTSPYTTNSTYLQDTDEILTTSANFGVDGTYQTYINLSAQTGTVDASYLASGDIYFDGFVADASLDAGELAAIDTWVSNGGVVISTNDDAGYDPLSSYFGLTIGGTASSTWNIADDSHQIMDGAFGSAGGIGDPLLASGTISYFDSASLAVGDQVLATDSVSGEPTIVLRQHGSGWILFTSDEGLFRNSTTGGGAIATPNDIFAANVFAWAVDSLAAPSIQMDLDVVAVNDAPTFEASEGTSVTSVASLYDSAVDIVVQDDGKYLVLTAANTASSGQDIDYAVTRYNQDGSLDTGFGSGGTVITAVNTNNEAPNAISLQADGKILVAGGYSPGGSTDSIVMRYNTDGSLDTSFSTDGMAQFTVSASSEVITDMAVQTDGRIVVSGYANISGNEEMFVARINTDGSLDTTFDGDGVRIVSLAGDDRANALTLQSDGSIVIVGQSHTGVDYDVIAMRILADGSNDASFGTAGIQTIDIGPVVSLASASDFGNAVQIDANGKIVIAGTTSISGSGDSFVLRLDSSGSLDASFATNGVSVIAAGSPFEAVNELAIQSDGKIVIAGDAYNGSNNDVSIVRLNSDGTLDTSFDGDGLLRHDLNGATDSVDGLVIDADGSIVVVGRTDVGGSGDSFIGKYNADGSVSERFALVSTLDGTPTYTEDGAAVVLDADVQIFDEELSGIDNFDGASLTLVNTNGASIEDVFSATGTLANLTQGASLVVGVTTIGSVTTNSSGTLVLTFNTNATNSLVNSALQQIAYSNSSDNPPATVQIDWTFDDQNNGSQGIGGALQAVGSTIVSITGFNDAPELDLNGSDGGGFNYSTIFTEGGSPVSVIDTDATITDPDNSSYQQLEIGLSGFLDGFAEEITIGGNQFQYGTSETNMVVVGTTNFDINFDGSSLFVITRDGGGTIPEADLQQLIRGIDYEHKGGNPTDGSRVFSLLPQDGSGLNGAVATSTIAVGSVNDAPTVTIDPIDVEFTEQSPVGIDVNIAISDVDDTNLDGATVRILSGYENGVDSLNWTPHAGITGNFDALTGTLTFSGTALVADYQSLLRTVSFVNSSDNPDTTTRTVEVVVDDGTNTSAAVTRNINVTAVNDRPTTPNASASGAEDTVLSIILTGADIDGTVQSFEISTLPANGTLYLDAALTDPIIAFNTYAASSEQLTLYFDPDENWNGATTFNFSAVDNQASWDTTPATATLTVTAVNDTPDLDLDTDNSAASGSDFIATWTEGSGPVAIVDADALVGDIDNASLSSLTVTLTNLLDGAAESLSVDTTGTSIVASYDSNTGVLLLSGSDTTANYQQVLRTITYDNSHTTPYGVDRIIEFVANDGIAASAVATTTLSMVTDVNVLVVTNLSDTVNGDTTDIDSLLASEGGDGISLREAILALNNTTNTANGPDVIRFDVAGAGPHTINLTSALPTITDAVVIDGASEPDFGGTPMVVLNGSAAGSASGLTFGAGSGGSTVSGMVINQFSNHGIRVLAGSDGNTFVGNYIGLDATGTADLGNGSVGILVSSGSNTIGGVTAADRNVISGNGSHGIEFDGASATNNTVQGNYIGTDALGTSDIGNVNAGVRIDNGATNNIIGGTSNTERNVISGNLGDGIYITDAGTNGNQILGNFIGTDATGLAVLANTDRGVQVEGSAANTLIGGSAAGAGNLISGNGNDGIMLSSGSADTVVQGNFIGTDLTGTVDLGNGSWGVRFGPSSGNLIGGSAVGAGNTIAFNTQSGVAIADGTATGNSILGNAIYANDIIGIDINGDGVTGNDADDSDSGANNLQNYPVLTSVATNGVDQLIVSGSLNTSANSTLRIEFFASASADGTGHGEAERFLDFIVVTADASGDVGFNAVLSSLVANGESITATATVIDDLGQVGVDDRLAYGDTSEFAFNRTAVQSDAPILDLDDDNSVATGADFEAIWSEGGGPIAVTDTDAILLDLDSANLTALTVTITNQLDGIAELLAADTTGTAIVASYDAGTGVLSLTGSDSIANYQQVLRTITYNNTSEGADTTTRQISFQANDGTNLSSAVQTAVAMSVANDAPTLINNALTIAEGGSVILSAAELSAQDPDNLDGALTFTVSGVTAGQFETVANPGVVITSFTQQQVTDSEIRFVHNGGEVAPAYNVSVDDGALATTAAAASITFTNVNDAPTGSVTIDNLSPAQGETLTASNTLADADGLSGPISYQWYRDGVAISGATGTTYTTVQADVGGAITAVASYTDDQGTAESVTSAATAAVVNINDAVVGQPVITGTQTEDETLTADTSGISDEDGLGVFSFQWYRDGVAVGGATAGTYVLNDADVDSTLTVAVSYVDGQGSAESTTSNATGSIANVNDAPTGSVTIDNTSPAQGETLTASNTLADADGLSGPISYQWYRDGVAIGSATSATYTTVQADVGGELTAVASYTDDQGTAEVVSSAATAAVANVNDAVSGHPVIVGTTTEDQTLTLDTSGISDSDGLGTFNYQWYRDGVAVTGATTDSYVLGDADVDSTLTVAVSYVDGQGTAESTTSNATVAIANVNDTPTGSLTIDNLNPAQGETLTVSHNIADADGLSGPISYQWYRDGVAIGGATGTTYTTIQADVGEAITAIASYTDDQGTAETVSSAATAAVTNVNDAVAGQPVIVGTTTEDQTLTVDTSGISDSDGLGTFSYQWYRDGAVIGGATADSLLLGDADVGANITVAVAYTDGQGTAESTLSAAVGPVANVNDAPAGTVTIDNLSPSEGDTLTASNSLADADGLSGSISYQWYRDGVVISGATGTTYTTVQADVGGVITTIASYTDDQGTVESVTSAATAAVVNVNDAVAGQPVITGTQTEDETLTADTSGISDEDGLGVFSYQWYRDGIAVGGATAGTYVLNDADVDSTLTVAVSYVDAQGTAESTTSNATGAIANVNDAPTGSVIIDNLNPAQGETLTASNSIADADGLSGPIGYQWYRDGVAIGGATSATYTTVQADVGGALTAVASYTDDQGTAEKVISAATAAVTNINDAVSGQPAIIGTTTEDQTLTLDTSGISDADGLGTFSYQWYRDGVAVTGATADSYVLGDADVDSTLTVAVSYVDGQDTAESTTSNATAAIANVNDAPTGSVTINNMSPSEGDILTVSNTLADADGLNGPISYQWYRDGVAIGGATGTTYTTVQADVGGAITAVASYTDDQGTAENVTSAATAAVANVNDAVVGQPVILGTQAEDQTLSADTTGISDEDGLGVFNFQWYRDGVAVGGATAGTYVLNDADVDSTLTVAVSYVDGQGTAESTTSNATGSIANVNDAPTGSVTIDNLTPAQGDTLTATNSLADADGLSGPISYQWYRDGVAIGGATGATYVTNQSDVGGVITATASYTDDQGAAESVTSAATAAVTNVNDAVVGQPVILGAATEDQTLTIDTSGISDADGLGSFSYQWYRDGVAVSGASGNSYVLDDADVGTNISVAVSYTDGYGAAESTTSNTVGLVANINDAPVITPGLVLSLPENTPAGTLVGQVLASDVDAQTTLGDWTIVSGNNAGAFSIDSATGEIRVADSSALDFESTPNFVLGVTVSDGIDTSAAVNVSVNLTDLNEAPVLADDQLVTNEDTAFIINSVMLLANDSDPESAPLTLVSISQPDNGIIIDQLDGTWRYQPNADFHGVENISYRVSDGVNQSTAALQIVVTSVNDAPEVLTPNFISMQEDMSNVVDISVLDADGDLMTFTLTGGADASAFQIDPSTGALSFAETPDYEAPVDADQNNLYELEVTANDGNGGLAVHALQIDLENVNETPWLETSSITVNTDGSGTRLGQLNAVDPDTGDVLSFAITGGDAQQLFQVDANSGELSPAGAEIPIGRYSLDVQVTDAAGLSSVATIELVITKSIEGEVPVRDDTIPTTDDDATASDNQPVLDPRTQEVLNKGQLPPAEADDGQRVQASTDLPSGQDLQGNSVGQAAFTQPSSDALSFTPTALPAVDDAEASRPSGQLGQHVGLTLRLIMAGSDNGAFGAVGALADQFATLSLPVSMELAEALDELAKAALAEDEEIDLRVSGAVVGTMSLSAGFVVWMLRGGSLMASLLSSKPMWTEFDPLPVFADDNEKGDADHPFQK